MCRPPANTPKPADPPSPRRRCATYVVACVLDVAVTSTLALFRPPAALNRCGLEAYHLGSTTVDLILFAVLRVAAYALVARRVASPEAAEKWADHLSHASLAQLTYRGGVEISISLFAASKSPSRCCGLEISISLLRPQQSPVWADARSIGLRVSPSDAIRKRAQTPHRYALAKGVGRALGARARGCAGSTILFDGACGGFAVFA